MLANLDDARNDVSAASAGGAPFLICFGISLALCAVAWFFLPVRTSAMLVLFQGSLALPAAFWLERRMGTRVMAADNPLRSLSIQLAMSQIVALPAVIVAYSLRPDLVPVAMAAVGGGHFLPYAWLQRTPVYAVLGVVVSLGAFALQVLFKAGAFPWILLFMALCYAVSAPMVYRNARLLTGSGRGGL